MEIQYHPRAIKKISKIMKFVINMINVDVNYIDEQIRVLE
jgi:hypothetical protein